MDRTIEIKAKATFNVNKMCWEVDVEQIDNFENLNGDPCTFTTTKKVDVMCCDEFVVANAILHANGIDVSVLYDEHDPIVNRQK